MLNKFINMKVSFYLLKMVYGTDIKLDFTQNDIKVGSNNDFELVSFVDNVNQAIKTRLLTKKGTLATHAEFGSDLYLLIGQNIDAEALNTAGSYVYQALEYEKRIKEITELLVDYKEIDGKPTLAIYITAIGIEEDTPLNLVVDYEV